MTVVTPMPERDALQMSAVQVRNMVLGDHEALRARIGLLRGALDNIDKVGVAAVRSSLRWLMSQLESHLDLEDQILVPIVETMPGFGVELAKEMRLEHAEQRAWIERTRRVSDAEWDQDHLISQAKAFALRLERDMEEEESRVVNERVLNDDWVSIEFGG